MLIEINYQKLNLEILDMAVDKEYEIIYYLCSDSKLYFLSVKDILNNKDFNINDNQFWFGANIYSI